MLQLTPKTGQEDKEFPLVTLGDDCESRGYEHGTDLRDRIAGTIDCYGNLFGRKEEQVFELASHFRDEIRRFLPLYAKEIEGIASGANVDSRWIYALNARTEILSPTDANECTAVTFPQNKLIGQTWDWAEEMQDLAVIMKIQRETRPDILMLTEPGIIGKIGMNSRGLGVCLNIVKSESELRGVPVHIMLRSLLDSYDLNEAMTIAESSAEGKSSNVIVADNNGQYFNMAYAGRGGYTLSKGTAPHLHTNHFFEHEASTCSLTRYARATELMGGLTDYTRQDMKTLLSDQQGEYPIMSPFAPQDILNGRRAGTVATLVTDLENNIMHVRKGNSLSQPFVAYPLNEES